MVYVRTWRREELKYKLATLEGKNDANFPNARQDHMILPVSAGSRLRVYAFDVLCIVVIKRVAS
jgi:hypothetical protein